MKTQTKVFLTTQERSAIMSEAMTKWWAARKEREAREAKKAASRSADEIKHVKAKTEAARRDFIGAVLKVSPTKAMASGVKVRLPKGTTVKDGKVKPPSPNIGRTQPQKYAAKTKKTWRKAG
jgi:hypothetical protein